MPEKMQSVGSCGKQNWHPFGPGQPGRSLSNGGCNTQSKGSACQGEVSSGRTSDQSAVVLTTRDTCAMCGKATWVHRRQGSCRS